MTTVEFNNDDLSFEWESQQPVLEWLLKIASLENGTIDSLSYVYCSDQRLLQINQQFLNHEDFTDVITFDLSDSTAIEGEIYISLDRISENAETFRTSFEHELCRVMAHGLLHLIGYKDKTESEKTLMRSKENTCLSLLSNVPRGTLG